MIPLYPGSSATCRAPDQQSRGGFNPDVGASFLLDWRASYQQAFGLGARPCLPVYSWCGETLAAAS